MHWAGAGRARARRRLCACAQRLVLSHAAAPRQSVRGRASPRSSGTARHTPAPAACERCARRRGLQVVGPGRAVSGSGVLCVAGGPAQRKREHPPPFPSALSPQARPLAAARLGLGAFRTADQARSPRTTAEPHHVCVRGWGWARAGGRARPGVRRAGAALCV